jgi:peptidoglycan/LPS O-acetylase OafA/YrhL
MAQTLIVEPVTPAAASPGVFDFRQRMPALDGLRGLAILSVFLYHYAGGTGTDHHSTGLLLRAMYGVTQFGWAGVDLFFVLSGFLITGILFDTQNDPAYYGKFYARRSLRIFPIYYLFLAIMTGIGVAIGVHWRAGDGWFLLYAGFPAALVKPEIIPQSAYIRITHLWSLCMEEQFYLVWPWLIAKLAAPKRILWMCVALMCGALTLRILVWGAGWLSAGWAYTFLPFRMDSLALGAALAILIRGKHTDTLAKAAPYVLGVASAGLVAVFAASRTTDHEGRWIDTIGFTTIAFASAGLLVLVVLRRGAVYKLFSTQALRTVGKYSYGLYLYHFPLAVLLDPIKPILQSLFHAEVPAKLLFVIFSLAANLGVAWASFVFIESPIMLLKRRFQYS